MKLSENFTLEEMCASMTADIRHIKNIPNEAQIRNLKILCQHVLQPTRDEWKKPIRITSGFRCQELNTAVGGVPHSYHLYGSAADIHVNSDQEAKDLAKILNKQKLTDKVIIEKMKGKLWIHVQWSYCPTHHILRINK